MSKHSTIRKLIAAAAISTSIGLTSLAGGAASADGPKRSTEAVYFTITLTNGHMAPTNASFPVLHQVVARNDTIKSGGPAPLTPTEELYGNYHFNHAK